MKISYARYGTRMRNMVHVDTIICYLTPRTSFMIASVCIVILCCKLYICTPCLYVYCLCVCSLSYVTLLSMEEIKNTYLLTYLLCYVI